LIVVFVVIAVVVNLAARWTNLDSNRLDFLVAVAVAVVGVVAVVGSSSNFQWCWNCQMNFPTVVSVDSSYVD